MASMGRSVRRIVLAVVAVVVAVVVRLWVVFTGRDPNEEYHDGR